MGQATQATDTSSFARVAKVLPKASWPSGYVHRHRAGTSWSLADSATTGAPDWKHRLLERIILHDADRHPEHSPRLGWFVHASRELEEAVDEAREEGFAPPTQVARTTARDMLRRLARIPSGGATPTVYPTEAGGIAVYSQGARGNLLIVCEPNGGVSSYASRNGQSHISKYPDTSAIPDDRIRHAWRDATAH